MSFSIEQKKAIVTAYLAASPTRKTTPEIVRTLVAEFGGNEAKIRAILSANGVYIAQPKLRPKVEEADRSAILARLDAEPLTLENREAVTKEIGADLGYTMTAIKDFAASVDRLPFHEQEINWRKYWATRDEEQRAEKEAEAWRKANAPERSEKITRKGPDGCGWLFIIGVAVAIMVVFGMDWRSDGEKRADAICGVMDYNCD